MNLSEGAYWIAALQAAGLKRAVTKLALYRWCVELEKPAAALARASAEEFEQLGLDQAQTASLRAALAEAVTRESSLGKLAAGGIHLLIRSAAAYPETLPQRLDEAQLPYTLFYSGDLELLCLPGYAVVGAGQPTEGALGFVHGLAPLASDESVLSSGYQVGIERTAINSILSAGGAAIIWLPMGLGACNSLRVEYRSHLQAGRLLLLSPVTCETPYSDTLAAARLPLVAAQSELLLAVEPDQPPAGWLEKLRPPLPRLAIWSDRESPAASLWQNQGAAPVADAAQVLTLWQAAQSGDVPVNDPQGQTLYTYDEAPVAFQDADSAIAALSRSGAVPDALARRLRECAPKWGK